PDDQLFSPTVFDDVAFGPLNMGYSDDMVKMRVKKALKEIKMEGYEGRCPHHLSFGEKKRICIATVLSMVPEVLILDEPTSNLDPMARRDMIRLFHNLHLTKIIATHDMEMATEVCNRVILLFQGKVVADGDTREILTDEKLLEKHGLEPPPLVRIFKYMGHEDFPLTMDEVEKIYSCSK
ncbi:MAG: ATP-binding cassette domain-containing protein, partial [Thermodesulfobacteriota bacterium]|nr:ATP-binding cassette domain-containing protein [Thermodesulfobacteriota bacterium]